MLDFVNASRIGVKLGRSISYAFRVGSHSHFTFTRGELVWSYGLDFMGAS